MKQKRRAFTSADRRFIEKNYGRMTCAQVAKCLGRTKLSVYVFANRIGIEKRPGYGRFWNRTKWTPEMVALIKQNYFSMSNQQLADSLGLTLTVTRNKCKYLGLQKMKLEYWTKEQIDFLKKHYKKHGNVEIAAMMQKLFPKKKRWTKSHIHKRMSQMDLHRTKAQISAIMQKNSSPGGKAFTITKNSSSKNMHDGWIANMIAWRNPALRKEILKRPDLIELKRQSLLLNRQIKNG